MWEFTAGVLVAGAAMYYIQPWVKDTVTKIFLGAPAIIAKARDLQARAEALIDKAKDKQATTSANRNDGV